VRNALINIVKNIRIELPFHRLPSVLFLCPSYVQFYVALEYFSFPTERSLSSFTLSSSSPASLHHFSRQPSYLYRRHERDYTDATNPTIMSENRSPQSVAGCDHPEHQYRRSLADILFPLPETLSISSRVRLQMRGAPGPSREIDNDGDDSNAWLAGVLDECLEIARENQDFLRQMQVDGESDDSSAPGVGDEDDAGVNAYYGSSPRGGDRCGDSDSDQKNKGQKQ